MVRKLPVRDLCFTRQVCTRNRTSQNVGTMLRFVCILLQLVGNLFDRQYSIPRIMHMAYSLLPLVVIRYGPILPIFPFGNHKVSPVSKKRSWWMSLNTPHKSNDMMTSSNGNIFRVTGHLCGKFTGPRWISHTKASDAELWCFFDLRLNKRLSKQPWGWWFETPAWSLWRHRNDYP